MNVVILAIHLFQFRIKTCADVSEKLSEPINGGLVEHFFAIFGHKDQVNMQSKDTMPSCSNVIDFFIDQTILRL